VRALLGDPTRLELHADERFDHGREMERTAGGWKFDATDTGFDATFGIEIYTVPESGDPIPLHQP